MLGNNDIIVSEDIILRRLIPLDANDIFTTIDTQRSHLDQWLPFVSTTLKISDTESYINHILNDAYASDLVFTIRIKDNFAGIIGFKSIDEINHKLEIGYWLSEHYQGRGVMTKSVKQLCNYAFSKMNINRIQVKCAVGNTQSSNIPKRLNFTQESIERQGELLSSGKYCDLEIYSLLKEEYSED